MKNGLGRVVRVAISTASTGFLWCRYKQRGTGADALVFAPVRLAVELRIGVIGAVAEAARLLSGNSGAKASASRPGTSVFGDGGERV